MWLQWFTYTCQMNYNNYWSRSRWSNTRSRWKKNKDLIFKNCASFADCISEINNIQVNNLKDLVVVMPIYNLIEYSIDNYSKTSRNLWQYYKDFQKYDIRDSKLLNLKKKHRTHSCCWLLERRWISSTNITPKQLSEKSWNAANWLWSYVDLFCKLRYFCHN